MNQNARKKSAVEKLSDKSRAALKEWLWADYLLYDFFKDELQRKKEKFGRSRMKEEVERLEVLNEGVRNSCVLNVGDSKSLMGQFKPWSADVLGFNINEELPHCQYFGISELNFIKHLRKRQMERSSSHSLHR